MTEAKEDLTTWKAEWQITLDAVGTDLSDGTIRWGADEVQTSLVRRYAEPLELNEPIHFNEKAAIAAGYEGIVLPATGVTSFTIPAFWSPGDSPIFDNDERNAQPARSPIKGSAQPGPFPKVNGSFATDIEVDFIRPVIVGERLGARGRKLISCVLKETSVGRGAFLKYESQVVSTKGDVVALLRTGTYLYDPQPASNSEESK